MKPESYKVEWENDQISLIDMFPDYDPDVHFVILKHFDKNEGCNILTAFNFSERDIWQQIQNDELDTFYMTLNHAERNGLKIAKDYYRARADFRRAQKRIYKPKRRMR